MNDWHHSLCDRLRMAVLDVAYNSERLKVVAAMRALEVGVVCFNHLLSLAGSGFLLSAAFCCFASHCFHHRCLPFLSQMDDLLLGAIDPSMQALARSGGEAGCLVLSCCSVKRVTHPAFFISSMNECTRGLFTVTNCYSQRKALSRAPPCCQGQHQGAGSSSSSSSKLPQSPPIHEIVAAAAVTLTPFSTPAPTSHVPVRC